MLIWGPAYNSPRPLVLLIVFLNPNPTPHSNQQPIMNIPSSFDNKDLDESYVSELGKSHNHLITVS